jgi:hypothetical protein
VNQLTADELKGGVATHSDQVPAQSVSHKKSR